MGIDHAPRPAARKSEVAAGAQALFCTGIDSAESQARYRKGRQPTHRRIEPRACGRGNFPLWLAPNQVRVITIGDDEALVSYSKQIVASILAGAGLGARSIAPRVATDAENQNRNSRSNASRSVIAAAALIPMFADRESGRC